MPSGVAFCVVTRRLCALTALLLLLLLACSTSTACASVVTFPEVASNASSSTSSSSSSSFASPSPSVSPSNGAAGAGVESSSSTWWWPPLLSAFVSSSFASSSFWLRSHSSSSPAPLSSSPLLSPPSLSPSSSSSSSWLSVYSNPASPPSFLAPARLRCALLSVDGSNHRAVVLQLGSPAQSLRLLVDTGSADLWVLNSSYCQQSPTISSHSCFYAAAGQQMSATSTTVNPTAFKPGTILDDGEPLSDVSAHAAQAVANLPLQMEGSNVSVLLGAADVTLQDSLLGYPTASTQRVSFILSNPSTVFTPPIPSLSFPYPITSSYNSLLDVDGLLGVAYNPLASLVQLYPNTYPTTAFLQLTQAIATQPLATTFALVSTRTPHHARAPNRLPPLSHLCAACSLLTAGLSRQPRLLRRHRRSAELPHSLGCTRFHAATRRPHHLLCPAALCCTLCAERWRDALVWSYPGSVQVEQYHSFLMFDLSVCGVNLQAGVLQSASQPLNAVVDSGSSCLGLPAELFDALVTWLPVVCSDSADGEQLGASTSPSLSSVLGGNVYPPVSGRSSSTPSVNAGSASNVNPHVRFCWLAADLLVDVLPTLSFRMSASNPNLPDSDPSQPVRLLLPLADLILGTARSSFTSQVSPQRLCLYRSDSLSAAPPAVPTVTIGGRSLASLHAAFAMDSHQLGLANQASVRASNATCVQPVRCTGQQSSDPTYNLCTDPSCGDYYFFTLHASQHACQLSPAFHVLGALAIAVFLCTELGLNEYLIRLSKRVQGIGQQQSSTQAHNRHAGRRRSHRR